VGTTSWVLDVRVDEERVGFRVDVLPVASEAASGERQRDETRDERRAIDDKPQNHTTKTKKNTAKCTKRQPSARRTNQKKEKKAVEGAHKLTS
jgi:hypothetical protein